MGEPADLARETILTALDEHFGVAATALDFIPGGEDSSAWVYGARTQEGTAYVVKVRRGQVNEAGLAIPRYLQAQGVGHIVAPLQARSGSLWVAVYGCALMVYPFVAGRSAFEAGMSEGQWVEFGAALRQIHGTALPPGLLELVRRETYIPKSAQLIRDLDAHIGTRPFADSLAQSVVAVWRKRREQIYRLVDRAEGLRLRANPLPPILCHADIHTANLLVDAEGRLWIVDWDEVMLAPRERDLMFVVGGIGSGWVNPQQTEWFFRGYGQVAIDPLALAYYRYDWSVQDIAAYAERVLLRHDLDAESRRSAVRYFMVQFEPGGMVEIAESSPVP